MHPTAEQERLEIAAKREAFRQQMSKMPAHHLVFLDESGATTKMARTHARAPRWLDRIVPVVTMRSR